MAGDNDGRSLNQLRSWFLGIIVGLAIGISIGAGTGNVSAGIAIGVGVGIVFAGSFRAMSGKNR